MGHPDGYSEVVVEYSKAQIHTGLIMFYDFLEQYIVLG